MCTVASHNGDMYSFTSLAASTHASCSVTTDAIFIPFSFNLIDFSISFNNFICIGPILCLSFLPGISPGCFLFFCSDGSDHCHCHHLFLFWCQFSYFFVIYESSYLIFFHSVPSSLLSLFVSACLLCSIRWSVLIPLLTCSQNLDLAFTIAKDSLSSFLRFSTVLSNISDLLLCQCFTFFPG